MPVKITHGIGLTVVSLVVAVALTWAFIVLPYWVSEVIYHRFQEDSAGELWHGPHEEASQSFIRGWHLRAIGYVSLALVVALIVIGIVAERSGLAAAGGVALFLPVLGHFALSMFFLAGLGLLRTLWIPLLDASYGATGDSGFGMFGLAGIVYVPYIATVYVLSLAGIDARVAIGYLLMAAGLFVFVLGMLAWFTTRLQRKGTADLWLYRFSRHPQYLGWIVWSYGLLLYWIHQSEGTHFKISWGIPDSSPWLIATMVIIGVAMLEEIKMCREQGAAYQAYREMTPFLLPLPPLVSRVVAAPMRLILGKQWPDSGREVAVVVVLYAAILFFFSALWGLFDHLVVPYGRLDLYPFADEILAGQR